MRAKLGWLANAKEVAGHTRVHKVQLGRLHDLLPEVGVPAGQTKHEIARFEHREPRLGRIVRDAGVGTESRQVNRTRRAPGGETKEIAERPEIADIEQLAYVALHIRGDVVAQPLMRRNLTINNARVGICSRKCQWD